VFASTLYLLWDYVSTLFGRIFEENEKNEAHIKKELASNVTAKILKIVNLHRETDVPWVF